MLINEMSEEVDLAPHEIEFIEWLGLRAHMHGEPRISGQIWAVLVLASQPLSAADIAKILDVSKASVSTNTRFLEEKQLIQRVGLRGKREQHFILRQSPYGQLAEKSVRDLEQRLTFIQSCKSKLDNEEARRKMGELETYIELGLGMWRGVADKLRTDAQT